MLDMWACGDGGGGYGRFGAGGGAFLHGLFAWDGEACEGVGIGECADGGNEAWGECMSGGYRLDEGKLRWELVPALAMEELVRVYGYGLIKGYPPRNWERGMSWGRVFGALMRHAWRFWAGEDEDPESGLCHMAHVAWNALALVEYWKRGLGEDDRPYLAKEGE